jgi:hypothetical protein
MPNWRMIYASILLVLVSACNGFANRDYYKKIAVLDGQPFNYTLNRNSSIAYEGKDFLIISSKIGSLKFRARQPAVIHISPNGEFIAYNYGNGSGQQFLLEIVDLDSLEVSPQTAIYEEVSHHINKEGCALKEDEISIIFDEWSLDSESFYVKTEDLSDSGLCPIHDKRWQIST